MSLTPPTTLHAPEPSAAVAQSAVPRSGLSTVMLATDLSPASKHATAEATRLAEALGARLIVVNVIDGARGILRADQLRTERERPLMAIVDEARLRGIKATFLLWTGEPGQGIVSAAEAEHADLVVVGTRALGVTGKLILGSVSDYVVNHSPCPVVIAR
jgi:nucleotide-binding universal stress UspA family protein